MKLCYKCYDCYRNLDKTKNSSLDDWTTKSSKYEKYIGIYCYGFYDDADKYIKLFNCPVYEKQYDYFIKFMYLIPRKRKSVI